MRFRTDISFLRAVAVLIVLLFHFGVAGFNGGFIGVDVFFVISGFLMTQITLNAFDNNTFFLKDFYAKRIKRIIPALMVVLLFVLLISIIFFFQSDVRLNAKYIFLANVFSSNLYFWKYQDYFSSTDNILLHTWTLGVEWQFYIIYPLILLLLKRLYITNKTKFWITISLLCLASFFLMLYVGKRDTNFIFYMLPARYWELSIGGLAFVAGKLYRPSIRIQSVVVSIGILTICLSTFFITERNLWPSALTLFPVLSTVAILVVNADLKIFRNRMAVFFGNISYSLYLWHWPWFILFKYFGFFQPKYIILIITLSVVSAYFSYRFIETRKSVASVKVSLISVAFIAIISALTFFKPELVKSFSIYQNKKLAIGDYTAMYLASEKEKQFNPCGCYESIEKYNKSNCLNLSDTKPNIFLVGDSHAAQFSSVMRKSHHLNFLEASTRFVLPIIQSNGKPGNKEVIDLAYNNFLKSNKKDISLVIISASWLMRHNPNIGFSEKEVLIGLKETLKFFKEQKITYLVIGQTETYNINYPKIIMLYNLGRNEKEFLNSESYEINEMLKRLIPAGNYVDVFNNPLITHYDDKKNLPYMFDDNHLTNYGAEQVYHKIIYPRIMTKLKEKSAK